MLAPCQQGVQDAADLEAAGVLEVLRLDEDASAQPAAQRRALAQRGVLDERPDARRGAVEVAGIENVPVRGHIAKIVSDGIDVLGANVRSRRLEWAR